MSPGLQQQNQKDVTFGKGGRAIIETPERASVSKYLAQFDKPDNVALMPDKSLATPRQKPVPNHESESISMQQEKPSNGEKGESPSLAQEGDGLPQALTEVHGNGICKYLVDSAVPSLPFAKEKAAKPLRVCCFGSSSGKTPETYLRSAAEVGYLLAVRGHTCVNGAGTYGCMSAMNEGAAAGNGHIVGVIHKLWLVDGDDRAKEYGVTDLHDGGAHSVFDNTKGMKKATSRTETAVTDIPQSHGGPHPALSTPKTKGGPVREMLVAGGKDLQERKRLLVEGADGLIVLPGGPGTWDELWEMACARNIGLSKLPIVCVNINGFYDAFKQILQRAWDEELTKLEPEEIMHFVDTAEEAVHWVEEVQKLDAPGVVLKKRQRALRNRNQSVLGSPAVEGGKSFLRSLSMLSEWSVSEEGALMKWSSLSLALGTGLVLGFLLSERLNRY
ncbi:hypothetical protein ACA910_000208 [Epithemia clementina (nom. ined.)]